MQMDILKNGFISSIRQAINRTKESVVSTFSSLKEQKETENDFA